MNSRFIEPAWAKRRNLPVNILDRFWYSFRQPQEQCHSFAACHGQFALKPVPYIRRGEISPIIIPDNLTKLSESFDILLETCYIASVYY